MKDFWTHYSIAAIAASGVRHRSHRVELEDYGSHGRAEGPGLLRWSGVSNKLTYNSDILSIAFLLLYTANLICKRLTILAFLPFFVRVILWHAPSIYELLMV